MSDRTNQHFVPKFYFRNFSVDNCTIGALLTSDGRTFLRAPLKGQCAKKNFYGSKELESLFSQAESCHQEGIIAALDTANNAQSENLSAKKIHYLLQAVLFQRSRTALEAEKSKSAHEKMATTWFKHWLRHRREEPADEIIEHIEAGRFQLTENRTYRVNLSIATAMQNCLAITDLNLCLLRNRTDYPFIFSDAPVVFYNSYCRKVRNRGVLGLQCPGLQIFFPLDSWTLALLIDGEKYRGPHQEFLQHDLYERSDVSQINALQLHHSLNAVYFGHSEHAEYVHALWHTHKPLIKPIRYRYIVRPDLWIDGAPPEGELHQMMQPQIEHELSLSFISCDPVSEQDYVYAPRSPQILEELKQREREWNEENS